MTSQEFDRHYADVKSSRDTSVDSHDWRPKFAGDIVTMSDGYRHSFVEPVVPGANASKKFKNGSQRVLHSKFSKILRDYSKSFGFHVHFSIRLHEYVSSYSFFGALFTFHSRRPFSL